MTIRPANAEDLERIVGLLEQLGYAATAEQVGERLNGLRATASGEVLVAGDIGNVAGVAIIHIFKPLHVRSSWALLSALVVDDACRSAGIGAGLLAAAERFAAEHHCSQLELSSSAARTRAHLFYERHGYQERRLRFVKILSLN